MDLLAGPMVATMPRLPTLGIRVRAPFRGMLKTRDELLSELVTWIDEQQITDLGHFFLRLYVVDMAQIMDLEVGVTEVHHCGGGRVQPGEFPAGQYATLTYRNHAYRANKLLQDWARENAIALDVRTQPDGDHFGCRTELYLTDPRTEPRKTRWSVQLSISTASATRTDLTR